MTQYTITLTTTEELAMQYIAADIDGWIQNAVHERARIAVDEIVQLSVQLYLQNNMSIPSSKEAIVAGAYAQGWITSAADRNNNTTL
jgi:hypothetical protein